jgi:hypothetical protein
VDWFEEHKARQQARRARAESEPVVEVTGIIPSTGVALVQLRDAPTEEVVTFDIWRIGQGPWESGKLRLIQEATGDRLPFGSLRDIPPTTPITTKARVSRAEDEALGIVAARPSIAQIDPAIVDALERQKTPETFHDPQLGRLTADPLLGWIGTARWLGDDCRFSIDRREDLQTAHALWRNQQRWTTDAIDFAADRLVDLKNSSWLDEGETPVSVSEFRAKIRLTSMSIGKEGAFVLDFDDGDLFWGHTIIVEGSLQDGLTAADLAG